MLARLRAPPYPGGMTGQIDPARLQAAQQANAEGMAALRSGNGASAAEAFRRAIAEDSSAGALWRNLAHALRMAGDDAGEREALEHALEIDRTDILAQLRKAQNLERAGEEQAALTAWSGALQLAAGIERPSPELEAELAAGRIDPGFAAAVGRAIAAIHSATQGDAAIAARFATDDLFAALRIEPYLLHTARAHPDLAAIIEGIAATTQATRAALVHGDVSPKNILCGRAGPVLIDAECAWYGDPAFDLAFCCTHMLLKGVWHPQWEPQTAAAFDALHSAYLDAVTPALRGGIEARAIALLAAILLARIDGRSPVEYLTQDADRNRVRRAARQLLQDPPPTLAAFGARWRQLTGQP